MFMKNFFFSLTGIISVGLGNRSCLTHNTSNLSIQIVSQSATDLFQHRVACPSISTFSEGATVLPDLAGWPSEYIVVNSVKDLKSCTQIHRSYLNKC